MRKSAPKLKKIVPENLDIVEIRLNREKVEAATKLLPPVPKKIKIKAEPKAMVSKRLVKLSCLYDFRECGCV